MTWPYVDTLELEARVRARSDLSTRATNPQFVSHEECQDYIQKSWEKLYNYLVGKYEDYFVKIVHEGYLREYTTEAAGLQPGYKDYSFPPNYFKLIKIDLFEGQSSAPAGAQLDGVYGVAAVTRGQYLTTLKRLNWMQERLYLNPDSQQAPQFYILYGRADHGQSTGDKGRPNGIRFLATPDSYYSMEIVYIPRPPLLESVRDGSDGMNFVAGWDEYVVLDASIKCVGKRDQDTRDLKEERSDWLRTVEEAIAPRDAGQAGEITPLAERGMFADNEELMEWYR